MHYIHSRIMIILIVIMIAIPTNPIAPLKKISIWSYEHNIVHTDSDSNTASAT